MLTINAQSMAGEHYPYRCTLLWFVADGDGERVFETEGRLLLDTMQETGGMVSGADRKYASGYEACIEFCGDIEFWVSPNIKEAVRRQRSDDVACMLRS
jgi:hypothetical protein